MVLSPSRARLFSPTIYGGADHANVRPERTQRAGVGTAARVRKPQFLVGPDDVRAAGAQADAGAKALCADGRGVARTLQDSEAHRDLWGGDEDPRVGPPSSCARGWQSWRKGECCGSLRRVDLRMRGSVRWCSSRGWPRLAARTPGGCRVQAAGHRIRVLG